MNRWNITAEETPFDAKARIVIKEADNGEWVRYEDADGGMELTMLQGKMNNMETGVNMLRSSHTNLLIDIQVALEDDDPEEALTMLKEALQ